MLFISVDCGTTNLRCRLCDSDGITVLCETKRTAGGRDTALTGSNLRLRAALCDAVSEILARPGEKRAEIAAVILSGTITSAVGVYHVHHLPAPAGPSDSSAAAE
ncbi:MAG: 2-dehydro-3-deoxygalactonokinase, partial [Clostridia bacterium]|nr:2-dehydro-3-deoxygalactonokinase [Clostridia bacterium]